jgi:hypothetical protein
MDELIVKFNAGIKAFEKNPTKDGLKEILDMARQISLRLKTLTPAALAAFQRALSALGSVLSSATVTAILGTAASFGGLLTLVYLHMLWFRGRMLTSYLEKAISDWVETAFDKIDLPFDPKSDCWKQFKAGLRYRLHQIRTGKLNPNIEKNLEVFSDLIDELIECLYVNGGFIKSQVRIFGDDWALLKELLIHMLKRFFWNRPILVAGISLRGLFGQPKPLKLSSDKVARLVEGIGLKGLHRKDGFGYSELPKKLPSPITPQDIDVNPDLPLGAFSDEELKKRQNNLKRMIAVTEKEIARLQKEVNKAIKSRDPDQIRRFWRPLRKIHEEIENLYKALREANKEAKRRGKETVKAPPKTKREPWLLSGEGPKLEKRISRHSIPKVGESEKIYFPEFVRVRKDGSMEFITDPKKVKKLRDEFERLRQGIELPKPVKGWRIGKRWANGMVEYNKYSRKKIIETWLWDPKTLRWIPPAGHPDPNPITPDGNPLSGAGTF